MKICSVTSVTFIRWKLHVAAIFAWIMICWHNWGNCFKTKDEWYGLNFKTAWQYTVCSLVFSGMKEAKSLCIYLLERWMLNTVSQSSSITNEKHKPELRIALQWGIYKCEWECPWIFTVVKNLENLSYSNWSANVTYVCREKVMQEAFKHGKTVWDARIPPGIQAVKCPFLSPGLIYWPDRQGHMTFVAGLLSP